jgi:hypothetical protein
VELLGPGRPEGLAIGSRLCIGDVIAYGRGLTEVGRRLVSPLFVKEYVDLSAAAIRH